MSNHSPEQKIWISCLLTILGAFYGGDIINFRGKTVALACGPNGADVTFDAGQTWQSISTNNLWVSDFTESGKAWLAGTQGKIFKLVLLWILISSLPIYYFILVVFITYNKIDSNE